MSPTSFIRPVRGPHHTDSFTRINRTLVLCQKRSFGIAQGPRTEIQVGLRRKRLISRMPSLVCGGGHFYRDVVCVAKVKEGGWVTRCRTCVWPTRVVGASLQGTWAPTSTSLSSARTRVSPGARPFPKVSWAAIVRLWTVPSVLTPLWRHRMRSHTVRVRNLWLLIREELLDTLLVWVYFLLIFYIAAVGALFWKTPLWLVH